MINSFKCPLCKAQSLSQVDQHYAKECPMRQSVSHIGKAFIICDDLKYFCLRCLSHFTKSEWQYHRKKIRTHCANYQRQENTIEQSNMQKNENEITTKVMLSTPSKPTNPNSQSKNSQFFQNSAHQQMSINQSKYYYPTLQRALRFSQVVQLTERQKLVLLFIEMFISKSKLILLQWIQNNKSIKNIHLQTFFNKYIDKSLEMLKYQIKQPTFQLLNNNYKARWSEILEEATDIFDRKKILEKVSSLRPTVKLKILRCINSIYKHVYGDIFQKFVIESYQPLTSREKLPIKTIDFLCFLEKLFQTKQRDLVHIGIDLLLIFQSGQRFVSDRLNLEKGVQEMLQIRQKGEECFEFQMLVNKTKKKVQVILGSQLCTLLQEFHWKGFYRNGSLYSRFSKILGFGLYSLKRGLLNEYFLQQHNKINLDIKTLAGHSKITTTDIYTGAAKQWIKMQIKDRIKVPNLRIEEQSVKSIQQKLGKTSKKFKKYVKVGLNWLSKLKMKLRRYNKESIDFCSRSAEDKSIEQLFQEKNTKENQQHELTDNKQIPMPIMSQKEQQVKILDKEYSFVNKRFNLSQLFTKIEFENSSTCFECKKQLIKGFSCIFCLSIFHSQCLSLFCSCTISTFPVFRGLQLKVNKPCTYQIQMPSSYFGDFTNSQALNTIKFLILARRFHYTTTQMQSLPVSPIPVDIPNLQLLHLSRYQQYQQGSYFPPIQLRISGNSSSFGTGFGLFATNSIPKYSFIGQYAADIVNTSNSILIRKPDSTFDLNTNANCQGMIIGPVFHCSYACLINGSRGRKPNCISLKVLLNGILRVIIYTKKSISAGQELHYDYESGYEQIQSQAKKSQHKTQRRQNKIKRKNIKCGLVNYGQTCYYNAVFQALKMLPSKIQSKNGNFSSILAGLFSNMDKNNEVFDLIKYIDTFEGLSQGKFKKNQQNDAHQLLIYLFDNFHQAIKNDFLINIKAVDTCTNCSFQTVTNIQCLTYNIQASEARIQQVFKGEHQSAIEDYSCMSCNRKVQLMRKQSFISYPQFLIIHLQRYKSLFKDKTPIKYNKLQTLNYKLKSAIIHVGHSVNRGHYKTLQVINQAQYIMFDDQFVYQSKQLFYEDCYLLIYQRFQEKL